MAKFSPVVTAEEADWDMAMKKLFWYVTSKIDKIVQLNNVLKKFEK